MGIFGRFKTQLEYTRLSAAMKEMLAQQNAGNPNIDTYDKLQNVWNATCDRMGGAELRHNGDWFIRIAATFQRRDSGVEFLSAVIALFAFEGFKESNQCRELQNTLLIFENMIRRDGGTSLNNLFAELNPNTPILAERTKFDLEVADAIGGIRRMAAQPWLPPGKST